MAVSMQVGEPRVRRVAVAAHRQQARVAELRASRFAPRYGVAGS